jgi:lipoprotein-releasing system permease protein
MRYLRSKKASAFLSLITVISILGVSLGVMAMIVVLSVMDGFEEELKKRLMRTDLHVLVSPTSETLGFERGLVPFGAFQNPIDPRIKAVHPVLSTELILRSARRVTGIVLKGIQEPRWETLKPQITETAEAHQLVERQEDGSELTHPGITIGNELAYSMGLIPGDFVTLISPTETEGTLADVPRLRRFVVEAIYKSGFPDQELHVVFARARSVESFF